MSNPGNPSKSAQRSRRAAAKQKGRNCYPSPPFHPGMANHPHPEFDVRPELRRALFRENMAPVEPRFWDTEFEQRNASQPPRHFFDDSQLLRSYPGYAHEAEGMNHQRSYHHPEEAYQMREQRSFDEFSRPQFPHHNPEAMNLREFVTGGFRNGEPLPLREANFFDSRHHRASQPGRAPLVGRLPRFENELRGPHPLEDVTRMFESQSLYDHPHEQFMHPGSSQGYHVDSSFHSPERDANHLRWSPTRLGKDRKQSPSPRSVYDFVDAGHPSRFPSQGPNRVGSVDRPWCSSDSPPHRGKGYLPADELGYSEQVSTQQGVKSGSRCSLEDLLPSQEELEAYLSGVCTK